MWVNNICETGAMHLTRALAQHPSLTSLSLENNLLCSNGGSHIAGSC